MQSKKSKTPSKAPEAQQVQPGGQFGFTLPNFTGAPGAMTHAQFASAFAASMSNADTYASWIAQGTDIRNLNPNGAYFKHMNLRTIVNGFNLGHPDYDYIHANHPEWILRDANGNTIPLFLAEEECVDFGNDDYLDYALSNWMPNMFLDSTDDDPNKVCYYLHDNGNFKGMNVDCSDDPISQPYTTDAGMQKAWKHMLDRFKARWPNKRIIVSSGPLSYETPAQQLPVMKEVFAHSDGYYSESLTSDHVYWSGQPNDQKRNALETTMQLADWLAANDKYFFPNLGPGDGVEPTQAETNYGYAFFNVMRSGDRQFYAQVTKDANGLWQPKVYAEMNLALGEALEERKETAPDVYRKKFEKATAYVNLSNSKVSITLPDGTNKNSLGAAISSPLSLNSFSGLTVYHGGGSNGGGSTTQLKGHFEGTIEGTFTPA